MENLFTGRSVHQHMLEQLVKARTSAEAASREDLEERGAGGVVEALLATCALAAPALHEDGMAPPIVEERGSHGAEVTISVPFTGERTLFFVRPSSCTIRLNADVQRSALVIKYSSPTRDAAVVGAEVKRIVSE